MAKEILSNDVLSLLREWGRDYDRELAYTKAEHFYDIDATYELDIFKDDEF